MGGATSLSQLTSIALSGMHSAMGVVAVAMRGAVPGQDPPLGALVKTGTRTADMEMPGQRYE